MKKLIALVLSLLAVASLVAGCSSGKGTTVNSGEKSVTFSLLSSPASLDPATTTDGHSLMVETQLFSMLVESKGGTSSEIKPDIAESWEISELSLIHISEPTRPRLI